MDEMDELPHDSWWQDQFSPLKGGEPVDYIARDGRTVVKVPKAPQGTRGLYSGVMELALFLSDRPEIDRACLVLTSARLSMDRLRHEWTNIKGLFQPAVSRRLSLVAVGKDDVWVEPDEQFLRRIAKTFRAASRSASDSAPVIIRSHAKQKQWEVLKVLLHRWLLREGAVSVGNLAKQVGCSYPTVREALEKLEERRNIVRHSNRSVELARFPVSSWSELLAVSGNLSRSFRYRDVSGEKTDPERLIRRLERMKVPKVAVGGVAAARHWHADFDLHGTPRIDLLLHAAGDTVNLDFVKKLDPALRRVENYDESPVLVVRLLQRADPLFARVPGASLPFADPVETALDLYDLGLTAQASQLFAHFRPEVRLA
jgi:hypothetical protein